MLNGKTEIDEVKYVLRGYEELDKKLNSLGAKIILKNVQKKCKRHEQRKGLCLCCNIKNKRKEESYMPKKKKNKDEEDEFAKEIIIGLNSEKKADNPPKKKKKKSKKKNEDKIIQMNEKKQIKPKKKKKKKRKGKLKKILKLLLKIVIVIGILIGIILFLFVSPVFSIKEINVNGANEITESVYKAMSGIEIGDNIFSIAKSNIIMEIKKEPYVETVEIKSVYPSKIEINIVERKISYLAEQNGRYFFLDKHGYILETNLAPLDYLIIKGCTTNFENLKEGDRIGGKDLGKFNDLIKIVDGIQNNGIETKLNSVDISNDDNYVLEFPDDKKTVMLGDTKDLSAKMTWIDFIMKQNKNESGMLEI